MRRRRSDFAGASINQFEFTLLFVGHSCSVFEQDSARLGCRKVSFRRSCHHQSPARGATAGCSEAVSGPNVRGIYRDQDVGACSRLRQVLVPASDAVAPGGDWRVAGGLRFLEP